MNARTLDGQHALVTGAGSGIGEAIAIALARAGAYLDEAEWIALARQAFDVVLSHMVKDGRLGHSYCAGKLVLPGLASDLAAMARAGIALHEATGARAPFEAAQAFLEQLEAHHRDPATGGYFLTADDGDALIVRPFWTHDEAVPNYNAVAADALVRLSALVGDDALRARADRILTGLSGAAAKNVLSHGAFLNALDTRLRLAEIVVTGERKEAFAAAALAIPFLSRVVVRAPEAAEVAEGSVIAARIAAAPPEGAAFVCVGERCSLPVADPAALVDAVAAMAG